MTEVEEHFASVVKFSVSHNPRGGHVFWRASDKCSD